MTNEELLKRMRAAQFVKNNGRVLRIINILRDKYVALADACCALESMEETRFLDSVNFLSEAGYIRLRHAGSKALAELADADYHELEAKVTEKGIRLLGGGLRDEMVDA